VATKRKKPASTAIERRPPAQLSQRPEIITGELVRRPDEPHDPLTVDLDSLPSEASKTTMRSRLTAAASILSKGSTAETFPWRTLDASRVLRVMQTMRDAKAEPATINLTRSALRGMARTLFGLRLLDAHERQSIDDIKPDRGTRVAKRPALDGKQVRKLFRAAAAEGVPETTAARDVALLAVLYGAGLRRDEASKLDVADYRRGELRVRGKGNKERLAPIGNDAARAVERWIEMRGDSKSSDGERALFLTINKAGRIGRARLSGNAIFWKVSRKLAKRASIGTTSPHALRRSFITAILELGEDLSTAAKAAGHASVTTTARYDRRDGKRVAEAVGRIVVPIS
jgi:integrase/recombinase XerD